MKKRELLKIHIRRRIPAALLAVFVCTLFSLYYFGFFDLSFIERPYAWKDNLNMLTEIFMPHLLDEDKPANNIKPPVSDGQNAPDDNTDKENSEDNKEEDDQAPEVNTPLPPQGGTIYNPLVFESVEYLTSQGYTITDKPFDDTCVFAKLSTPYDLPEKFSYTYKAFDKTNIITYTDGTESTTETVRISKERPAIDLYMGYIIYDNVNALYLIGPDGTVMCEYDDTEYIPAYTRDLQGRPLFYKYEEVIVEYPTVLGEENEDGERPWEETEELKYKTKKYYYLAEDGETFEESDYNDATDNRGLYFDYPSYYGKSDNEFNRYYISTTKVITDLEGETTVNFFSHFTYSKDENMDLKLFHFDKFGLLTEDYEEEEEEEENEEAEGEEVNENDDSKPDKTPDSEKDENADADGEGESEGEEEKEPFVLPEMLPLEKREPTEEEPYTKEELFPYTMGYSFSEGYATVFMDIDWSYDHDMEGDGVNEMKTYEVTTNELRVIDEEGKIMFSSRKNFYSDLNWTAHEKYTAPLLKNIESIGSYYFDHGLMRVRLQSWDCYHQAQFDQIKVVTDEDILIDPSGKRHELPSGYTLKGYSDGILLLYSDGKYGYMDTYGRWIRDPFMDDARPFLEGVAVCKNAEGNYGLIDTNGNTVIPFNYSYMSDISGGTIAAYSESTGWTVFQKLTK